MEIKRRDVALRDGECHTVGTSSPQRLHRPPHHGVRNTRSSRNLRHTLVNNLDYYLMNESNEEEHAHGLRLAHGD